MKRVDAAPGPAPRAAPADVVGAELQRLFRDMLFRRKARWLDGEDEGGIGAAAVMTPALLPPVLPLPSQTLQPGASPARQTPAAAHEAAHEAARLDAANESAAQSAAKSGTLAAMANRSGEYQVELNLSVISRSRLRVRAASGRTLQVVCESDSAGEREWFSSHQAELVARIQERTGQDTELVVAPAP